MVGPRGPRAVAAALARRLATQARERALHALGRPSVRPFGPADPERRARTAAKPLPDRTYVILFTPRSGSTRLGEILGQSGLSHPREVFNPRFVPGLARKVGAHDLASYADLIRRDRAQRGVMGLEATWWHVRRLFVTPRRFADLVRPDAWLWLVREDLALQAVSLARLLQTGQGHDQSDLSPDRRQEAEAAFAYDAAQVAACARRLARMERDSEALLAALGARPLRLSYERLLALGPEATARLIAAHVGAAPDPAATLALTHRKLGGDKNAAFAARFRADHPGLLRRLERARLPTLRALERAP